VAHAVRRVGFVLGVLTAIAMTGCNSGVPPVAASATSSARVALKITGGQVAFPTVGGYGAVFRYSPNHLSATTTVDLATTSAPMLTVPGGAQPPGVQLAAFRLTLGTRITFACVTVREPLSAPSTADSSNSTATPFRCGRKRSSNHLPSCAEPPSAVTGL
jgi:hypothetical protein